MKIAKLSLFADIYSLKLNSCPQNTYDAIAIISSHNALATAAYLARARWKVLVLEMGDRPSGWVRTDSGKFIWHCPNLPNGRIEDCNRRCIN